MRFVPVLLIVIATSLVGSCSTNTAPQVKSINEMTTDELIEYGLALVGPIQLELADTLFFGKGLPKDYVAALKLYENAGKQGIAVAQFNAGFMYFKGHGAERNYKEAIKWLRLAAKQNLPQAQYSLAVSYDNGYGVIRDAEKAFKWYSLAAKQGDTASQYAIGSMYSHGEGVPQDIHSGLVWLNISALRGNQRARLMLDEFEKKLSQALIERYRRSATEIIESTPSFKKKETR